MSDTLRKTAMPMTPENVNKCTSNRLSKCDASAPEQADEQIELETVQANRQSKIQLRTFYGFEGPSASFLMTRHEAQMLSKRWITELGLIEAISFHGGGVSRCAIADRNYIYDRLDALADSGLIAMTEINVMIAEEERRRLIPPSYSKVPVERKSTRLDKNGLIEWADIE